MMHVNKDWLANKYITAAKRETLKVANFDLDQQTDMIIFLRLMVTNLAEKIADKEIGFIEGK